MLLVSNLCVLSIYSVYTANNFYNLIDITSSKHSTTIEIRIDAKEDFVVFTRMLENSKSSL